MKNLLALIILDGWGICKEVEANAIAQANALHFNALKEKNTYTELEASGEAVGLPAGLMGNSEVGHLNIGAGRIVYQEIMRINLAIKDKSFKNLPEISSLLDYLKKTNKTLHLMGLVSEGGVHTSFQHLLGILDILKEQGITNFVIHSFLDGRDTPPQSGIDYIKQLNEKLKNLKIGKIATVMGRYYAMDRDKRWDRVKLAYDAMVFGKGEQAKDAISAVETSYAKGKNDEFVLPTIIVDEKGNPVSKIQDQDAILFFNFRGDRAREITRAFVDKNFNAFEVDKNLNVRYLCMTQYDETIPAPVIFKPGKLKNILGEVLANNGLKQLRIAETEKYAHVTFFFNGGEEVAFSGEDRILVSSPKVATYDLKPEMSAYEVKDKVVAAIKEKKYDVVILNFANPDMVGHTGMLEPAIKAIKAVDACLGEVIDAVISVGGKALITADHGNAEVMQDPITKAPQTAHTTNKVPLICVDPEHKFKLNASIKDARLSDIAPTMLKILNINIPQEMTGRPLV